MKKELTLNRSESKRSLKATSTSAASFLERNSRFLERKENERAQKITTRNTERLVNEIQECTFKPKTNPGKHRRTVTDLLAWNENKEEKLLFRQAEKETSCDFILREGEDKKPRRVNYSLLESLYRDQEAKEQRLQNLRDEQVKNLFHPTIHYLTDRNSRCHQRSNSEVDRILNRLKKEFIDGEKPPRRMKKKNNRDLKGSKAIHELEALINKQTTNDNTPQPNSKQNFKELVVDKRIPEFQRESDSLCLVVDIEDDQIYAQNTIGKINFQVHVPKPKKKTKKLKAKVFSDGKHLDWAIRRLEDIKSNFIGE